ncbi:carbohydrate porin [Algoriphagus namhaensis]|uniref:Carbohydrate porin n=1 Tax=Algoriphagus namhaensis TaxID=915353 RepID=A0ABV8AL29_9BACT
MKILSNNIESMKSQNIGLTLLFFLVMLNYSVYGQDIKKDTILVRDLSGPNSVSQQMNQDNTSNGLFYIGSALDSLDQLKKRFYKKTGFIINADYNSQIMGATEAIGDNVSASGVFRIYGKYNLVGRGTSNEGGLVFKVENRHKYTNLPLREWGLEGVGYAGLLQSVYNNDRWRVSNLYWRQTFAKANIVAYAGFLDVTDWTDIFVLASPWSSFNNLSFATGSSTIGGLYPDGSLGLMVSAWLTDDIYVIGGLIDANGSATKFYKGFDTFFTKFETLKTFEIGFTPNSEMPILQNLHVTLWQVDETASAPSGWGLSGSISWELGNKLFPYLRGGWAKDGGSIFTASVSTGIGYNVIGSNVFGLGLNWNRPNEGLFGTGLKDQYLSEIFYKLQVTHHIEFSPNIQFILNPALNTNANFTTIFGARTRINI